MHYSKIAGIFFLVVCLFLTGCKKDDDSRNQDDPNAGADHTYTMTFTGGALGGQTFSGEIPNNNGGSLYSPFEGLENTVFSLNEGQFQIVGIIKRENNDTSLQLIEDDDSLIGLFLNFLFEDKQYQSLSGNATISNYQTHFENGDSGISSFKLDFNGEFKENPSEETVLISGSLRLYPPD